MVNWKDLAVVGAILAGGYFLFRGVGSGISDLGNAFSGFFGGGGAVGGGDGGPSPPSRSVFNPPGPSNPISNLANALGFGAVEVGVGVAGGYTAIRIAPALAGRLSGFIKTFRGIAPNAAVGGEVGFA